MRIEVQKHTSTYVVNATGLDEGQYRARLFVYYPAYQSYSYTGCGLTVLSGGASYDDWSCPFRPPRIDAHKFNAEVSFGLIAGNSTVAFNDEISPESESYIETSVNPINMLVERNVLDDISIVSIRVENNAVYLELDRNDIDDGTAVTVDNAVLSDQHLLGPDGLRICGNYRLERVKEKDKYVDYLYKYKVDHYADVVDTYEVDPNGYTLTVWEACYYEASSITLTKVSTESASFDFTDLRWGSTVSFDIGDEVCVNGANCRIIGIDGTTVLIAAELDAETVTVDIKCCPRVPSSAIPVNWPTIQQVTRDATADEEYISNAPLYDHTSNTELVSPITDTYFVDGETDTNHDYQTELVCSHGKTESVTCMQFAANSINATDTSSAELHLYVEHMSYSETTVVVYQMTSSAWSPAMTYQQISPYISNIPIGTYTIKNPTMGDVNTAVIASRDPSVDDYHGMVTIPISSSVLSEWLSGDGTYTPSIAIRVIGSGDESVTFASSSGESDKVPFICVTGGESDEIPVPFEIELSSQSVQPGQILRITPRDQSVNSFGNSIFNSAVIIGGVQVPIEAGNPTYLDVSVPDQVYGSVPVYVLRKDTNYPITDEAYVYIDSDKYNKSVALAKKLKPGVIDSRKVSASALYNRDMGFVNMTEVTDETSLIQNVYMILLTNPGERLFSQDFGTGIEQRLFKLGSSDEGLSLLQECIRKVSIYEPRVYIDGDQSSCEFDDDANQFYLLLCCVLPTGRSEFIRLPFKNRGTVV